ncbi:MAG: TetR/AcrR family transcriptional regulator [Draconibacterium sp.]|nr:TetR/AcrR family transcriptional regulator [Draconibacterium sp.]
MSPRSAKQYSEIRKQKKELIMETALELFAENGFHATSMSQIAKKAGISKGLAYNYFQSKNEILEEILETSSNEIYKNIDINHDGILTEEEFYFFIKKTFQLINRNRRFWKLYTSVVLQTNIPESKNRALTEKLAPTLNIFRKFLISKGSLDPDGDLIVISTLIKGASVIMISSDFYPFELLEEKIIAAIQRIISYNHITVKL